MRCLVDLRVEWVREDGPGFAGKTDMNAPLPFDLTTSFADVGPNVAGVCVEPVAPRGLSGRPGVAKPSAFVERRRAASGTEEGLVRSPAVLGFVGVVWGLVLSAILTFGVSAGLALTGVSWMAAGYYCAAIILLVFGLVGIVLYWGTRAEHPSVAGMERYLEAAVERRRQYLYLSSINALENARRLGMWERRFDRPQGEKDAALSGRATRPHDRIDSTGFVPGPPLDFARCPGTEPRYAAAASG